jgi:type II secretory pathway pseudopilin PulG
MYNRFMDYGATNLRRLAFSLIEMAMVLAVSGMMVGFVLQANLSSTPDCNAATKQQLQKIADAVDTYALKNNRLPYPARRTLGVESPNFGREDVPASLDVTGSGAHTWGALPFQTLGLPDSYAGDCWGNKFTYVVTSQLTNSALMGGYPDVAIQGLIRVNSNAANAILTNAAFVVISHGADGWGAVKINYSDPTNTLHKWCGGGSLESFNCNLNGTAMDAVFNDGKNANLNLYDDLVIYHARLMKGGVPVAGICNNTVSGGCTLGARGSYVNNSGANCTLDTWQCLGSSGGANASCSFNNPCAGACGGADNTCTSGSASGYSDSGCGGARTWSCSGSYGGASAACSNANTGCPVCGGAPNTCGIGAATGYADSGCGGSRTWVCNGYGGSTAGCSLANSPCPINGVCGGGSNTCAAGNPGSYSDSGCGGAQTWGCYGLYGGSDIGCAIANSPCPINGGWGGWGGCDAPCGGGTQYRSCDSPTPQYGGADCPGNGGYGGAYQSCNTTPCAVPVNGQCTGTYMSCVQGNPIDNGGGGCGGTDYWTCQGSGGGSDAGCSAAEPTCVVNGVCDTNAPYCIAGTYPGDIYTLGDCCAPCGAGGFCGDISCSSGSYWHCMGSGGGSDAYCNDVTTYPRFCS